MNGCELIKSALRGEMPDRRPVMLHSFMLAARESGYSMKQYRNNPTIAAKCHINFVEKYGVDGILFDVDTALIAGAAGVPVDFPDDEPARTHHPLILSLDDVDSLNSVDISKDTRIQHTLESVRILKKYFNNEIFIRGNCDQAPFSLASIIRTPGQFMLDLIMDPDNAVRLLELSSKISRQFINLMSDTGVDMVSNGDSPAGPEMISPEMYEKFALPYEKEMVDKAHESGIPYLLHICGNTDLILDKIPLLDLDAIELDYKTSIQKIYTKLGSKTTLFGTIDPSGVLTFASPKIVREKCAAILELFRGNPHLVIGAGCAIPPIAPEENIRALISEAHNSSL